MNWIVKNSRRRKEEKRNIWDKDAKLKSFGMPWKWGDLNSMWIKWAIYPIKHSINNRVSSYVTRFSETWYDSAILLVLFVKQCLDMIITSSFFLSGFYYEIADLLWIIVGMVLCIWFRIGAVWEWKTFFFKRKIFFCGGNINRMTAVWMISAALLEFKRKSSCKGFW